MAQKTGKKRKQNDVVNPPNRFLGDIPPNLCLSLGLPTSSHQEQLRQLTQHHLSVMDPLSSREQSRQLTHQNRRVRNRISTPPREQPNQPPPNPTFPWSAGRCQIHNLHHLTSNGIHTIEGHSQCRRCDFRTVIQYDLYNKFVEVASVITSKRAEMRQRAPDSWMHPVLPNCGGCGQPNCMKPVVPDNKDEINWLFMLLGQTLGCCNLEDLKFFCKYTYQHRTGAKDRVLYLTYLNLCKQLDSTGPFDP